MFTHSWALMIGGALVAAPILVHWLTRPRPVRYPTSTLRFIRGAVEQRRARHRLRDWLVLLCRTAAIVLLAVAVSRPIFSQLATPPQDMSSELTRIVILDCSQSMAAREEGMTRFDRARPVVASLLEFRPGMNCNLLLSGASPQPVFDTATTNLGALREALTSAKPRPERMRVQSALNAAADLLAATSPGTRRELIVVSDFQRSNWAAADFSGLPEDCEIQLKSVATAEAAPDLAVLNVSTAGRVEAGRESEITVQIGNYSETARQIRLELRLGGVVVPFEGTCPRRAVTTLVGSLPPMEEGWRTGQVRLIGGEDALSEDDVRPVAIHVQSPPKLALLTRERGSRKASAAYYVEQALLAYRGSSQPGDLIRLDAADPDLEALRSADVIVVARPGQLGADPLNILASMIRRGKGVLYFAADPVDAANLQELARLLGSAGRLPVEFLSPSEVRSASLRRLTDVDRRQSPFAIFGDELQSALQSLEFRKGLMTRPLQAGLQGDVRGSFDDRSAFLVSTAVDRGRLVIFNMDLEQSNLPRTPVFVPLLGELLTSELTGRGQDGTAFACGEPFSVPLPVGEEHLDGLKIVVPSQGSDQARGRLSPTSTGLVWEVSAAGSPGIYQVQQGDQIVAAVATAIPDEEADLRALSEDVFSQRLAGNRKLHYQSSSFLGLDQQDTAWVWLAAAALFCLLLEISTLKLFRG